MTELKCCFLCQLPTDRTCEICSISVCSDNHLRSHRRNSTCLPFRVDVSLTFGRHFVATRDIEAGETILIDEASVVGPATKTDPLCLECFQPFSGSSSDDLALCSCGFYLCHKCISLKGGLHEQECLQIKSLKNSVKDEVERLQFACIFLIRFWMLRSNNPKEWDRLCFLNSGETKDLERADFVQKIVNILQNNFGAKDVVKEDVLQMMGIKRTNASNLASIGLNGAIALYPTYTLMNSHCSCNTRSKIDPKSFTMKVKANREIKSGEEISTRYVTVLEGQPQRRKMIWDGWKFICNCQRCLDPTEFGTFFSAIKCRSCCSGFVVPEVSNVLGSPWKCKDCDKMYGNTEIEKIIHELEVRIHGHLSNANNSVISPSLFISEVLEEQVHPSHFLIVRMKNNFFNQGSKNISKKIYDSMSSKDVSHLRLRIEEQINYGNDILGLIDALDPGFGFQKGHLLKSLATLKMQLAKLKYCMNQNQEEYNEHMTASMDMIKKMSLCL